jgi:hypothetical protein
MIIWERPTGSTVLERLRAEAELSSIGRGHFVGTLAQRNQLWVNYRNFVRQAISNFRVALGAEHRSASLLYYYAMLNFAKAELLRVQPASVVGFIRHGLRFNVTRARSVGGDSLSVEDGAFKLLYQHRTGYVLPSGTRLPIKRLLARIPEIQDQLGIVGLGASDVAPLLQLIASDGTSVWVVLAIEPGHGLDTNSASGRYFRRRFRRVDPLPNWRDVFGVSRRSMHYDFFESVDAFSLGAPGSAAYVAASEQAFGYTWSVRDILGLSTSGLCDAWISPSLYKTRMLPMPPSLARYAVSFYASSLVRYRPSMFDSQFSPDQAYLFDALARECALPMLIDTLSALSSRDIFFLAEDAFRV